MTFTPEERRRLMVACRALRTTYVEFVHFATMQAISECEGYARDQAEVDAFYERMRDGRAAY